MTTSANRAGVLPHFPNEVPRGTRDLQANLSPAEFGAGTGQCRTNGVLGNPQSDTDLAIASPLDVILPDDFGVHVGKTGKHLLDFVAVVNPLDLRAVRATIVPGDIDGRLMRA